MELTSTCSINNASIGKENGGCSSIYRYCYCELNELNEPGIGAAIAGYDWSEHAVLW